MALLFLNKSRRIISALGLTLAIITAFLFIPSGFEPVAEATGHSLTPGAGCLNDNGVPVEPLEFAGAWAIILNFNHGLSSKTTTACWAVRDNSPNMTTWYIDNIQCQLINNVNGAEAGNGKVEFDGDFHIACPKRGVSPSSSQLYNQFYVHTIAEFPTQAGTYPLVWHPDLSVSTQLVGPLTDGSWQASINSRYGSPNSQAGSTSFSDSEFVSSIAGVPLGYNSRVRNGIGTHYITQELNTQAVVSDFEFDFTNHIRIGGGANPWTLHEIIIDPPGLCSNC